jgi:hypothetical protein
MRTFQDQGMIKAVGMRGPHRFATDRLSVPRHSTFAVMRLRLPRPSGGR